MPRDPNGTYTLPAGNPVTTGEIIEADWANDTMPDLGAEMTDSLSRSGKGGMGASLTAFDGTVFSPGINFLGSISTGMYWAGAGDLRIGRRFSPGAGDRLRRHRVFRDGRVLHAGRIVRGRYRTIRLPSGRRRVPRPQHYL